MQVQKKDKGNGDLLSTDILHKTPRSEDRRRFAVTVVVA